MQGEEHSREANAWDAIKSRWPNRQFSSFVCAGGIQWHLQRAGGGPALLLLHGTGASTHSWRAVLPRLAAHFDVICPDLPGHGFTDPMSPADTSIDGFARALNELLRALEVKLAYAVGHSAGAVINCKLALDRLISPRELICINGAFFPPFGSVGRMAAPLVRRLAASSLVSRTLARHLHASTARVTRLVAGTGSRIDAEGVELYAQLAKMPRHVLGVTRMLAGWDLVSFAHELPHLQTPLALLVGEADRMVPAEEADQVQRQVTHATIHRFAGLGHLAHEEAPDIFVDWIVSRHARRS